MTTKVCYHLALLAKISPLHPHNWCFWVASAYRFRGVLKYVVLTVNYHNFTHRIFLLCFFFKKKKKKLKRSSHHRQFDPEKKRQEIEQMKEKYGVSDQE